ncbi:MAG: 5-formyltetrahydrofolate cyclo-ligase [Roseitalea sp.]|jgi:5-formyltetrahydrofolate cyclo-ligase|nr:5-formyltetrahydrofolate cyclo-ligase [Roseitalea sp.]MBO6723587.1 5-formyltetrahydrofolate cyclo-ligase [Roseitalea sp.]MBO6741841.1 5-formyltetrahydrofolate cyclo-ligase [Roseitalea sp.]
MTGTPRSDPPEDKAAIRAAALARRDALAADHHAHAARALADHAGGIGWHPGNIVSGFWPIRSEIDPRPLMEALAARGAIIALPAVIDRQTIVFRRHDKAVPLVPGGFGTMAPGPDAKPLDPDLMLIPLSAFDDGGNRIGYGAGHYDRAIARLVAKGRTPRLVGLAFECQRVNRVPAEPHDVPLHTVLTENGLQALPAQR